MAKEPTKYKGKPRDNLFNPTTKCCIGKFDRFGNFETNDPEIILQIAREKLAEPVKTKEPKKPVKLKQKKIPVDLVEDVK